MSTSTRLCIYQGWCVPNHHFRVFLVILPLFPVPSGSSSIFLLSGSFRFFFKKSSVSVRFERQQIEYTANFCMRLSGETPQALEDLAFEKNDSFLSVFFEGLSFLVKNE